MRTILAPRASTILYDLLLSRHDRRPLLLPANVCPVVPITCCKAGVPFELVDVAPAIPHLDLNRAEARLRQSPDRFGGLVYVHTYGDPDTPHAFFREIKDRFPDLLLVDDRCLCVPDLEPDCAAAADATLYSTGYAKIVDLGEGGFAFLSGDVAYQHHVRPFSRPDLEAMERGYKSHLASRQRYRYADSDWLQTEGALLPWTEYAHRVRMACDASLAHRKTINAVYSALLPAEGRLADSLQGWRFNLRVPDKKRILDAIFAAGLFASSHYASLDGIMAEGDCPQARDLAAHVINLFNDHHYTVEQAEQTCRIILENL